MSLCEVTGAGAAANLKLNQTQLPSNHFSSSVHPSNYTLAL